MLRTRHQQFTILLLVTLTVIVQLLLLQGVEPEHSRADPATLQRVAVDPTADWRVQRRLEQVDQMIAAVLASNSDSTARATSSSRPETVDPARIDSASFIAVGDPEEQFLADLWTSSWPFDSAIATRRLRLFPSPIEADGGSDHLLVEVPTSSLAAAVVSPPAESAIPSPVGSTQLTISAPWEFEFLLPTSTHERWPFSPAKDNNAPPDIVGVEIPF